MKRQSKKHREFTHDPDCAIAINARHGCTCGAVEIIDIEPSGFDWTDHFEADLRKSLYPYNEGAD